MKDSIMKRGRKLSSDVWEHFSPPNVENKVKCNYCHATLSYCQSTGSLMKHLKQKHPFTSLTRSEEGDSPSPSTSQLSVGETSSSSAGSPAVRQRRLDTYVHRPLTPQQAE
uniref:uncharacterized protein LOC113475485 n=1 Tax=Ciona intestinalis TaxID=7719 RepID=UPI000EF45FFF|nr:uncharacterized protein LOC113475485 [Ciona intestinalis]|eukprot:XP_026695463.1 uncharacterized protein LOC113475485 [Ciona intestinalis]